MNKSVLFINEQVIRKGGLTFKDTAWHRECFTCTQCVKALAGEKFTSQDEKPYCADCYSQLFAKKCFSCSEAITGEQSQRSFAQLR